MNITNEFKEGLHYDELNDMFYYNIKDSPTQSRSVYVNFKTVEKLVADYISQFPLVDNINRKGEYENG